MARSAVRLLLVGRASSVLDRRTHRLGNRFDLALDADHLGRLVGSVGGDGHALVDRADTLGVILDLDLAGGTRHDGVLVTLGNRATAGALATGNDERLGAVVGHGEDTVAVAVLLHRAVVVHLLVEGDDRAVDHFLRGSEGKSAEDHGEGKEDLFHGGKG